MSPFLVQPSDAWCGRSAQLKLRSSECSTSCFGGQNRGRTLCPEKTREAGGAEENHKPAVAWDLDLQIVAGRFGKMFQGLGETACSEKPQMAVSSELGYPGWEKFSSHSCCLWFGVLSLSQSYLVLWCAQENYLVWRPQPFLWVMGQDANSLSTNKRPPGSHRPQPLFFQCGLLQISAVVNPVRGWTIGSLWNQTPGAVGKT